MRTRRALFVCLLLGACRPPGEPTPLVPVVPGKAAVWSTMFSDTPVERATVHPMQPGEALGGPNAIGRPGDLLLQNGQVVFVIEQQGPGSGFAESGGNLVDAADAVSRKDELGQMFTYFGKFPRQAVYTALASGESPDGSAWVEVRGHELLETGVEVVTRYTLGASGRALSIETRLHNAGASPVTFEGVGDAIEWGGAQKVAPGLPPGFTGPSRGPYVGAVGRFASYGSAPLAGQVEGVSGASWTDTRVQGPLTLGPDERARFARVFLVGERPDTSSIVAELAKVRGSGVLGTVSVELAEGEGATPIDVPADACVDAQPDPPGPSLRVHASGQPARLSAQLPAGRWLLSYCGGGGRGGRGARPVSVSAGQPAHATLLVSHASSVHVACEGDAGGPVPCKITFERTDGGPLPALGLPNVAGPAGNQVTTATGIADVPLAPGAYRVTVSRGPEYALAQETLSLEPGALREVRLALRRVVDTSGYLACDFHQHSMFSADSGVAAVDRVVSNVAEGVEIAVASEHNVIADLETTVRALRLDRELVSISGDELTSDASRHPWGHANAFPLSFDPAAPRGGAPAVRDRTPGEIWSELRHKAPADIVIQINHPRNPANGYFDLLGFDPAKGASDAAAYDATFDAIEVWNGRNVRMRARVLSDFLALLRASHPVTPTANTDTHGIVGQEAGYPRTYVRVSSDDDLGTWGPFRTQDLVHAVKTTRDVVLTNGPMLRVSVNDAPVGSLVRGPHVDVRVHVESAPWVVVDEARFVRASAPDNPVVLPVLEKPGPSGALVADLRFTANVASDDAILVVVSGKKPLSPVLASTPDAMDEIEPWAMTGATWVDADGDGRALGR